MQHPILAVHILAGGIALAGGFLALYAQKGRTVHRRAGRVFAYAMMAMTATGLGMSLTFSHNRATAMTATVTFYLVATGLLTVIRRVQDSRRLHTALLALGVVATGAGWIMGFLARGLPGGNFDKIPSVALFMFAIVGTLGVIGDLRVLRAGAIEGAARLRRHLWRMNYAMWVATTSFFYGQARHLPHWFRAANLNDLIVLLVAGTLVYWLVKLREKGAKARALAPST